jgi:hypothetical protein
MLRVETSVLLPAFHEEPGPGLGQPPWCARWRRRCLPTFEPGCRRIRIDVRDVKTVPARVEEDVRDGVLRFERRLDRAGVETMLEDGTLPLPEPVQCEREPDDETLDASRERPRVAHFDQEMEVVR